tara:strand:+ start:17 stop:280 length:264 start_codon:yes stop_codon:yes gene_type:complete
MYKKYVKAKAVTAHDTNELTGFSGSQWDALYVGVAGNANLVFQGDSDAVLFKNLIAGTVYPFGLKLVKSTSTTATDMVVLDSGKYVS